MNDRNNKISIIIPVFNVEKYIKRCVLSILKQSFTNFELIIINDGSSDSTEAICRQMMESDSRIHVLSQKNKGVSAARNLGLKNAVGKYIVFIDGDDYIEAGYLNELYNSIIQTSAQMAICGYNIVFEDGKIDKVLAGKDILLENTELLLSIYQRKYSGGYLWNKIFLRDIIVDYNLKFDESIKIEEDLLFVMRYMLCVSTGIYINRPLYNYVQRDTSAIHLLKNKRMMDKRIHNFMELNSVYRKVADIIPEKHAEVRLAAYHSLISECVGFCLFCIKCNMKNQYFSQARTQIKKELFRYLKDRNYSILSRGYAILLVMGWKVSKVSWEIFSLVCER